MKKENVNGDEYRIGTKCLYELYPTKIREKIVENYKLKNWDAPHKTAVADVSRQIALLDKNGSTSSNGNNQSLPLNEKLKKDDLEHSLEFLNAFVKNVSNARAIYDCVVYRTENVWVTVIDVNEDGNLEKGLILSEYSKTHDIKSLDEYLSISINVWDDGDVLEIVGMCCKLVINSLTRTNVIILLIFFF